MFRDLPPHLRMWEPTDEECAAADEQYWHDQAGQMGGSCFDLTDAIGNVLDRRMDEWRADDFDALEKLHRALTDALALAKSVPSVREPPPRPLGSLPLFAAGIANTHNEGE